MSKKKNPNRGTTLDDFLDDQGMLEAFETVAVKEAIAFQIARQMETRNITKVEMARRMNTSRAQLDRLLDPNSRNVTLETLQRAAHALGKQLRVNLV